MKYHFDFTTNSIVFGCDDLVLSNSIKLSLKDVLNQLKCKEDDSLHLEFDKANFQKRQVHYYENGEKSNEKIPKYYLEIFVKLNGVSMLFCTLKIAYECQDLIWDDAKVDPDSIYLEKGSFTSKDGETKDYMVAHVKPVVDTSVLEERRKRKSKR